jgi:hypothetical protein
MHVWMTPRGEITVAYTADGLGAVISEPGRKILAPFSGEPREVDAHGNLGDVISDMAGAPRPPKQSGRDYALVRWCKRIYGQGN